MAIDSQLWDLYHRWKELTEHEGMAILMVEHDMELVMKVCEWIHVLDYGAMLAVGTPEEIQSNPEVLDAYTGLAGSA